MIFQLVIIQEGYFHQAQELNRNMSSFTDDDDDMRALRAHSLKIEAIQSTNGSFDPTSDENAWYNIQKLPTTIEPNHTESWKRVQKSESLHKIYWNMNGKVRT